MKFFNRRIRITVIQCAGNKFTIILVQERLFFVKNRAKISFLLAFVLTSITEVSSAFTSWLTGAFDFLSRRKVSSLLPVFLAPTPRSVRPARRFFFSPYTPGGSQLTGYFVVCTVLWKTHPIKPFVPIFPRNALAPGARPRPQIRAEFPCLCFSIFTSVLTCETSKNIPGINTSIAKRRRFFFVCLCLSRAGTPDLSYANSVSDDHLLLTRKPVQKVQAPQF